jgi:hypothetical protein
MNRSCQTQNLNQRQSQDEKRIRGLLKKSSIEEVFDEEEEEKQESINMKMETTGKKS